MSSRSEEIQDIIDRMPTNWTVWTASIAAFLLVVLFALGFVIEYSDTIDGEVTVTGQIAPVRLVANANGRLHLLIDKGKWVNKGDIIGYIESGVDFSSYQYVEQLLKCPVEKTFHFRTDLEFGELGNSYNAYIVAFRSWKRCMQSERPFQERASITTRILNNKKEEKKICEAIALKEQICCNLADQLQKDSILLAQELISQQEYQNNQNNYMVQKESYVSLQISQYAKKKDIEGDIRQITLSKIEERESVEQAYADMVSCRNNLLNDLRLWKEKYLFIAPTNGELSYLNFWRENSVVKGGQETFTIIPHKNVFLGEVVIPSYGAGKVCRGQMVNVKLNDFPYDEYGLLQGQVLEISRITTTRTERKENEPSEEYLVTIAFPNGLTTNFEQKLLLNFESKGVAEIQVKPKRLIERLFDNLKAKAIK